MLLTNTINLLEKKIKTDQNGICGVGWEAQWWS